MSSSPTQFTATGPTEVELSGPSAQQAPGDLLALLRQLIRHELAARPVAELAVVEGLRLKDGDSTPANYDCDVHLHGRPDARFRHVPICTGHRGSVATPREGDVVLLQFIGGDSQRPVIVGRLHDDQQRAPDFGADEIRCVLPPDAAPTEHIDLRASAADGRRVEVLLADDVSLTVADGRVELRHGPRRVLLDGDDGATLLEAEAATVRIGDDGNIELSADMDLTLKAGGNISIEAGGNLDLAAGGNASIRGAKVDIN